jgi:hypothetical protein
MKIVVNKSASAKRKKEVIQEILAKAKECAEKGIDNFVYHFKDGERNSFPPPFINSSIESASEGSVKCAYRGDSGTHCRYVIVT